MSAPSPYSPHNPNLQVVWDSSSLKDLMFCPRKYEYSMLKGYRSDEVNLVFGAHFASAVETYKKARLEGVSKDEAQLRAIARAVEDSWIEDEGGGYPWGGQYEDQWRCCGTAPYKNAKGNKAKCPYSHKGRFFPAPIPDVCGSCGSNVEHVRRYEPDHPTKNRHSLVRLVAWYCEEQPDDLANGLAPYQFPNGQPAVELSVKLPLPLMSPYGDQYILAGHFDSVMQLGEEKFIADNKTTTQYIGQKYWQGFNPNIQVDNYDLMGVALFGDLNIRGVVIEAAQVTKEGAEFGQYIVHRNDKMREESLRTLEWWIRQAERFAEEGYWPKNTAMCWNCPFAGVCSKDPDKREGYLKANFAVRKWNPLEER